MSWYLQKNDGETYGPVEMDELQHWAAEGRIAPQDKLSQDNKHWAAAPDAAELGMDWIASMPDQPTYGPLHLRAFLDLIADGVLAADSRIQHRKSGKIVVLGDALLHALIPEIQGLQVHAEALQGRIDDQQSKSELMREELETDALRLEAKLIKENERLAERCGELESKAKDLEELSSNIESEKGEIVELAESHDQRVSELEQEVRDIEAKRRAAEEAAATRQSAIEKLEQQQKALEEQLAAGDQGSKEIAERANGLEKEAQALREKQQKLEEKSARQQQDLTDSKKALQAETKRWQQEVEAASAKAGETTKVEISRRKEIEGELKALRKTYDKAKTESEQRLSEAEKRYQSAEKALNDLKASAQKVAAEPGGKDNALSSGKKVGELEKELEQARIALKTETDRAENLEQQVANLTNIGQGSKINLGVAPSPEKRPETGRIDQVKELSVQNALMTKEIAKLKTMYEEERRAGLELENRMNERIGESKRNEADALVHQEDTARRLHHMELNYKKLTDFTEEGGSEEDLKAQFALLITSHNELSQSYDTLLTQLHQKTQEIDRQMAERHQIENEASDRIRVMEAITKREQDEAARMRQQFVRIQATHLQLVKSYREMNDRIICYRQQQDPDAAAQQSEIEGAAPATGPRIRLN